MLSTLEREMRMLHGDKMHLQRQQHISYWIRGKLCHEYSLLWFMSREVNIPVVDIISFATRHNLVCSFTVWRRLSWLIYLIHLLLTVSIHLLHLLNCQLICIECILVITISIKRIICYLIDNCKPLLEKLYINTLISSRLVWFCRINSISW